MLSKSRHRTILLAFRLQLSRLLIILLIGRTCASWGQTTDPHTRVAESLKSIHAAEAEHLPEEQQGMLWTELGVEYWNATDFPQAEDAYNKALRLLKPVLSAREQYARALDGLASLYLGYGRVADAENTAKHALTVRQNVGDPIAIAASRIHLADIALVRHQFKEAEALTQRGMQTLQSVSDPPKTAVFSGLITLSYARCSRKHCSQGLLNAQQAMTFAEENSKPESAPIGFARETLGFAEWKTGSRQDGEKDMQEAIRILRKTLAPADPRLAGVMLQYRTYLVESNRTAEARNIERQVVTMTRTAGSGCIDCEVSVSTLARGLR